MNRELYFKIERLNNDDVAIEEKTPVLIDGAVTVSKSDKHRRKCSFTLAEALPDDWLLDRWRLWYGKKVGDTVVYDSLGIFIPLDPIETERASGKVTSYQGVDKTQLLIDSIGQAPTQFTQAQTLKEVVALHLDAIGENRRNLDDLPYELNANYTFADYRDAEHTLRTLVNSFATDFYYDRNGIAVLAELPSPALRPISYAFQDGEAAIHTSSKKKFQSSEYWNKVIVVGGTSETDIYRSILADYSNDVPTTVLTQTVGSNEKVIYEDGAFGRQGQDFTIPAGVDNIRSVFFKARNPGASKVVTVLAYSSYADFNEDTWYAPTMQRALGTVTVSGNTATEYEAVFDTPFGVVPGEKIFFALINDDPNVIYVTMHETVSQYAGGTRYEIYYGGGGGSVLFAPVAGDLYFKASTFEVAPDRRRITRYFKDDVAASQAQVDALAVKYLDEGIRIPSTISIENLPITTLEVKDVIMKDGVKYEVLSFNIPLGLGLQTIEAGVVE